MTRFLVLFLFINSAFIFAQSPYDNTKRGTIRVKKLPSIVFINKKTTEKIRPSRQRIFWARGYQCGYKEVFPEAYTSNLFPLVFVRSGLILVDENRNRVDGDIFGFDYEIYKSNTLCAIGKVSQGSVGQAIYKLSGLPFGSSLWIKNLSYKDSLNVIHDGEIREFQIIKVK